MITELPELNDKDRKILSLLEENPEISQNKIAEKLCIAQSSISARIYKLRQKGLLAHIVGIDLKKAGLCIAMVNITTSDTSSIINSFENCPYFLNGFIISGQYDREYRV
jgi:Lrp/AsnC family transcriptional regulator, leucine-responsive regulatory protein